MYKIQQQEFETLDQALESKDRTLKYADVLVLMQCRMDCVQMVLCTIGTRLHALVESSENEFKH